MSATSESPSHRLVFLHGFTQTHHHWHRVAHHIAAGDPALTLGFADLPGHGLSADDTCDIEAAAAALPDLTGRATYIGYSMGGRTALLAALARPQLVERLVLIGATPGIDDSATRADRQATDEQRALDVEANGVTRFLDRWLAAPMFAGLPSDPDGRRHRERNTPAGLAHSLRTNGTGAQPSVWHRLDELTMPVLLLVGDRDEKFVEIARRAAIDIPRAELALVPDAGHAAHTEQPEAVTQLIVQWLRQTPPSA